MPLMPIGQRVRVNALSFWPVRGALTGTITGQPTSDRPTYRVALNARSGGETIDARPVELIALPTPAAEVVGSSRLFRLPWVTAREIIEARAA